MNRVGAVIGVLVRDLSHDVYDAIDATQLVEMIAQCVIAVLNKQKADDAVARAVSDQAEPTPRVKASSEAS